MAAAMAVAWLGAPTAAGAAGAAGALVPTCGALLAYFGASWAAGLVLNAVCKVVLPVEPKDAYGNPRWSSMVGVFFQNCVFPPLVWMSWRSWAASGGDVLSWLGAGWDDSQSSWWDCAFAVVLFGYLFKDMFEMPDPMLLTHHFVCGMTATMSLYMPVAARCFTLGTAALEFGSMSVNVILMAEAKGCSAAVQRALALTSLAVVSFSHVVAAWLTYAMATGSDGGLTGLTLAAESPMWVRCWFVPVTPALLVLRQKCAIDKLVEVYHATAEGATKKAKAA